MVLTAKSTFGLNIRFEVNTTPIKLYALPNILVLTHYEFTMVAALKKIRTYEQIEEHLRSVVPYLKSQVRSGIIAALWSTVP